MTELHRNIAWNIKRRRALLEISQMELAERAEISPGYVGEIEMGRKYPKAEVLIALAKALGVKPFRLLMAAGDIVEAAGPEALYNAMGEMKTRLEGAIDGMIRDISTEGGSRNVGGIPQEGGGPENAGGKQGNGSAGRRRP